jgi:hypothetical protein
VQQVLVDRYGIGGYCTKFNHRLLTHSSGRTDGTVYPVIWGANAGTQAYSCTAVNIQSSTGTLNANITSEGVNNNRYWWC